MCQSVSFLPRRADGSGYQWWISSIKAGDKTVATCSARGRGGQFICVIPGAKRWRCSPDPREQRDISAA